MLTTWVMIAALAAATAAALPQLPPAPQPQPLPPTTDGRSQPEPNAVIVQGCLSGSMLTQVKPREYMLVIPETLRIKPGNHLTKSVLKELNGHLVELNGMLRGHQNLAAGKLVKDTGKTKIYVGGTERKTGDDQMTDAVRQLEPPVLDVSSARDVSPACQEARDFH
jgi:hypothetical protein